MTAHPPDNRDTGTEQTGFRPLNPVLLVAIASLIVLTLATGEAIRSAFTPLSNVNRTPIALLSQELGWWVLASPVAALVVLWVLSGSIVRRRAIQILLSLAAFIISTGLVSLVFVALYIANTRY